MLPRRWQGRRPRPGQRRWGLGSWRGRRRGLRSWRRRRRGPRWRRWRGRLAAQPQRKGWAGRVGPGRDKEEVVLLCRQRDVQLKRAAIRAAAVCSGGAAAGREAGGAWDASRRVSPSLIGFLRRRDCGQCCHAGWFPPGAALNAETICGSDRCPRLTLAGAISNPPRPLTVVAGAERPAASFG